MSHGPLRIALAGFGAWGQILARALAAIDDARLVAVHCHGAASAEAAARLLPDVPRFADYRAMLGAGGFDVVAIATPNDTHARLACLALEAGAHVFLEKPLGLTLAECDAVIETAARTGGLVAVDHQLRVSHQWKAVRDLVAGGGLGAVRYQHLSIFRGAFRAGSGGWRHDPARVGSWALEELVHYLDLVTWYAAENGPPVRLRAVGNGPRAGLAQNLAVMLEWADGSAAMLSQCLGGFAHHAALELAASEGAIRTWWAGAMDRAEHPDFALELRRAGQEIAQWPIPRSGEVFELEEHLRQALAGFRAGHSTFPAAAARAAVGLCLAADEALRTGAPVELAPG